MCTLSKFWFSHIRPRLLICSYQSEHTMYFHTSGPRSRYVHSWKGLAPVSVVVFLVIQEAVQMPCCPPVVPPECELLPGCDVDVERLVRCRHWLVWSDTDQSDTDHQPTVWSHLLNISCSFPVVCSTEPCNLDEVWKGLSNSAHWTVKSWQVASSSLCTPNTFRTVPFP